VSWIEPWLDRHLTCPYDGLRLATRDQTLDCPARHSFPVVAGVPVLLREDRPRTHHTWWTTPKDVATHREQVTSDNAAGLPVDAFVDPFVEQWLVATCGQLYRRYRQPLVRYPIPGLRLRPTPGAVLLDVGSNWGRWALAASRAGFKAVALDPSLTAALAGRRVARQLGLEVAYVVADARHLPFDADSIDLTFSYSVLQHLDKAVVTEIVREMSRVTRPGGKVRVQLANVLGARQLYNQATAWLERARDSLRGVRRQPYGFRVRAWTPVEMRRLFSSLVGPTSLSPDGFFSLNAQPSDIDLLEPLSATVVRASQALCRLARWTPGLAAFADSLFVEALNEKP
jgi:SAM-dependent methyltransferase